MASEALQLAVWLSLPSLVAAWLAGLLASGVASFTRLGDATSGTVPRQLAVGASLWVSAAWVSREQLHFTVTLWSELGAVGAP